MLLDFVQNLFLLYYKENKPITEKIFLFSSNCVWFSQTITAPLHLSNQISTHRMHETGNQLQTIKENFKYLVYVYSGHPAIFSDAKTSQLF